MDINIVITLFSSISFIIYGVGSFTSKKMISEFDRWGYKNQRQLIGSFQFIGGAGLLAGLNYSILIPIASFLLSVLMIGAILVRIQIKDKFVNVLPATFYAIVNFIIFYTSVI